MNNLLQQFLPQIQQLMQQHGVEKAYAFGSAVKDSMRSDSDLDFIIRFPENMDFTTYANNYFSLAKALESLLSKPVDLITEKTLKNPFLLQEINSHKIQLI